MSKKQDYIQCLLATLKECGLAFANVPVELKAPPDTLAKSRKVRKNFAGLEFSENHRLRRPQKVH